MNNRNKQFFALCALLDGASSSSSARARARSTPAQLTASAIVRHQLLPILRAALAAYPEQSTDAILEKCAPALAEVLVPIIER
jgi:hypothetical protein